MAVPATADAFDQGDLSYSKVRTLTRVATADNEAALVAIAVDVPAGELGRVVAAWMGRNLKPDELAALHRRGRRSRGSRSSVHR